MKKYRCWCCGYRTLDSRGDFDICPVCFWEDDTYFQVSKEPIARFYFIHDPKPEELLDIPSGANHGLSLRQGRENYHLFGACQKEMLPYVRKPRNSEK